MTRGRESVQVDGGQAAGALTAETGTRWGGAGGGLLPYFRHILAFRPLAKRLREGQSIVRVTVGGRGRGGG